MHFIQKKLNMHLHSNIEMVGLKCLIDGALNKIIIHCWFYNSL
jgi:hypothetical protein